MSASSFEPTPLCKKQPRSPARSQSHCHIHCHCLRHYRMARRSLRFRNAIGIWHAARGPQAFTTQNNTLAPWLRATHSFNSVPNCSIPFKSIRYALQSVRWAHQVSQVGRSVSRLTCLRFQSLLHWYWLWCAGFRFATSQSLYVRPSLLAVGLVLGALAFSTNDFGAERRVSNTMQHDKEIDEET